MNENNLNNENNNQSEQNITNNQFETTNSYNENFQRNNDNKKKTNIKRLFIIVIICIVLSIVLSRVAIKAVMYFIDEKYDKPIETNNNINVDIDDEEIDTDDEEDEKEEKDEEKIPSKIAVSVYKTEDNYYTSLNKNSDDEELKEENLVGKIDIDTAKYNIKKGYYLTTAYDLDYINDKYLVIDVSYDRQKYGSYTSKQTLVFDYKNNKLIKEITENEVNEDNQYYLKENYLIFSNEKTYKSNIYDLKNNKAYNNLDGIIYSGIYHANIISNKKFFNLTDDNNNKEYIYDLTTGKKVTTLDGLIDTSFESTKYLLLYNDKSNKLYDMNYKEVLSNFDSIYGDKNNILYEKDNQVHILDSNCKEIKVTKKYDEIFKIDKEYILVLDGKNVNLLDYNDNVLTTFINDYTKNKYNIHTMLSGWFTDNGKNGIYIVVGQNDVTPEQVAKENNDISLEEAKSAENGLGYEYYYIPTTKETGKIAIAIGGYAKPVLYLYPTKKTNVTVNFEHEDVLTTTYPKFKNEWNVTANPNGDLYDKNGKYYYGLYWEEDLNHFVDFKEGFYVTKENAIEFLEEKLTYIGLNDRERNEFIMYWLPILEKNGKSLVYFELTEERDSYNKLIINPKPDSILRVAIHVKKVDKKINVKDQKLTKFNRKGFVAIEWGGINY